MIPSRALLWFCLSFLAGIAVESFAKMPHIFLWGALVGATALVAVGFFMKKPTALVGFCLLFLILGILRLQISAFTITQDELLPLNDNPEKITLTGRIINEPDVRASSQKLKVKTDGAGSVVLVTLALHPKYHYLDAVSLNGKLKTPLETKDFSYKNYLRKDGVYSVMDYPQVTLSAAGQPQNLLEYVYQKLLIFKGDLRESIYHHFSASHGAIIEGILLGGTGSMTQELKNKFSATGLTHITAISGSNVVIVSAVLMAFLLFLGLWRGQAFYISTVFIWLYIAIAGFPASGIRAAIMATVLLLSQKFGRQNTSGRVVVLTAAVMLLQNPMLLVNDASFQLSFLASLGIIYGKPLFDWLLGRLHNKCGKDLLDIISITLAAQLFTLPVIAFYFKNISLVAPITNLLIVPIIDWVMIFGFLAAFLGIFSNIVGFVFAMPTYVAMLYFMKVVDLFDQRWAVFTVPDFWWIWIGVYYIVLAVGIWRLGQKVEADIVF